MKSSSLIYLRHARPCAGHPRLCFKDSRKTWMAGTSPAMTKKDSSSGDYKVPEDIARIFGQPLSMRLLSFAAGMTCWVNSPKSGGAEEQLESQSSSRGE